MKEIHREIDKYRKSNRERIHTERDKDIAGRKRRDRETQTDKETQTGREREKGRDKNR